MKIKQALVVSKFFRDSFMTKYKMEKYTRDNKPVIFFGCYPKQHSILLNHKGLAVVIWAGGDAMHLLKNKYFANQVKSRPNIKHIAISSFISEDLRSVGIEHRVLPIVPFDNKKFVPVPLGPSVYFYSAHTNPEFYGEHILAKIKRNFPNIEFIVRYAHPPNSVPRGEIQNIYEKCFMALRLTPHDGMSNTVIEMGLMGRKCIWNGNSPNAIPWKYVVDICENIEKELCNVGKTDNETAERVRQFIDIPNDFLTLEYYENKRNY